MPCSACHGWILAVSEERASLALRTFCIDFSDLNIHTTAAMKNPMEPNGDVLSSPGSSCPGS